jgi:hypothetical protein
MDLLSISSRSCCEFTYGDKVASLFATSIPPLLLMVLCSLSSLVYPNDRGTAAYNAMIPMTIFEWLTGG